MDEKTESIYNGAIPSTKEAWRLMCKARKMVGWKDFYFVVILNLLECIYRYSVDLKDFSFKEGTNLLLGLNNGRLTLEQFQQKVQDGTRKS